MVVRQGTAAGVGAGLLWGLAFLLPVVLERVSAVDLTLGRYLVYGLLSMALLRSRPDRQTWRTALVMGVCGHVGYYVLLVIAMNQAGAALTAIVVGVIPATVAVAGAIRARRSLRPLRLPLALIVLGLALVNGSALLISDDSGDSLPLGLLAAAAAAAAWTVYGVVNAEFMTRRPDVTPAAWNAVVGVATLPALAVLLIGRLSLGGPAPRPVAGYLAGVLILGVLVSWLAGALWNRASADLPLERAGQLIVVETIAGVSYVYAATATTPNLPTLLGLALLTLGVLKSQAR